MLAPFGSSETDYLAMPGLLGSAAPFAVYRLVLLWPEAVYTWAERALQGVTAGDVKELVQFQVSATTDFAVWMKDIELAIKIAEVWTADAQRKGCCIGQHAQLLRRLQVWMKSR